MGAWGPALYSDDTTCDVRDRYVELLREGRSAEDAVAAVLAEHEDVLRDRDVDCLVTFALADSAWKHGRLTEALRLRAESLLATGGDVAVWERDAPQAAGKRRAALNALRKRLASTQPPPKTMRPRRPPPPPQVLLTAARGEVFLMPMGDGTFVPLVYLGKRTAERTIDPYFLLASWREARHPTEHEVRRAAATPVSLPSGLPGLHRAFGFHRPLRKGEPEAVSYLERTSLVLDPIPCVPKETPVFFGFNATPQEFLNRFVPRRTAEDRVPPA
jgi:hypothetical protein